jgi:hypothetical protein
VVEVGRLPRIRVVAGAALARKVIGRLIRRVARNTIRLPGVIKVGGCPGAGRVTRAALSREVIGRFVFGMA